jgi:glycosyltransferase involved in cell wall biosynthesis
MRILHVGSGFRPWRRGGLTAYTQDLMGRQVRDGHEVSYFFSGRQYPFARAPHLRGWVGNGADMFELINSPLIDHGRQPELEVSAPVVEQLFEGVLREWRPEVIHVQELAGLPSSLLELARDAELPVVVTLQDYFPLCPTFKLVDSAGRVCLRREIGADCVATVAGEPQPPGLMIEATVGFHLNQRLPGRVLGSRRGPLIRTVARRVAAFELRRRGYERVAASADAYQRRRDLGVERLGRAEVLIAMSERVAEIYAELGVDPERLRVMQLTLAHIEKLNPRPPRTAGRPLTFGTLAGFESVAKGGRLLIAALRALADSAAAGCYRLLVFGHIHPELAALAADVPAIEIRGPYVPEEQDTLLDEVDVGLVPSIWEEAYAYVGIEFLAKGIPVIANAIGGMRDYTREGETGWLNADRSATGLAALMGRLIDSPEEVDRVAAQVRAEHDSLITPLDRHAADMEVVYREAIERVAGG